MTTRIIPPTWIPPAWAPPSIMPDGHRLFQAVTESMLDDKYPLIACADGSGKMPQDTEDGILWLDFTRPLMMGRFPAIPLLTLEATDASTPSDGPTIILLSELYNWSMNVQGVLFKAVRS